MGYDLHISRKKDWSDPEGLVISFDEWVNYVSSDPSVQKDPVNGQHDFLYVAHPFEPKPLWWNEGEIYTKNPDKETVKKLVEIAQSLGARVLGDDGETYSAWARFPQPDPWPETPKKKTLLAR